MERFEEHLDIRSFLGVYTNLALLLNLILNKQQLILFKHQAARTIVKKQSSYKAIATEDKNSDDQLADFNSIGTFESKNEVKKKLADLLGYKIRTAIDL